MATQNDSTIIDELAETICQCIRHEVPDDAIHAHIEGIIKAAESRAADFLRDPNPRKRL